MESASLPITAKGYGVYPNAYASWGVAVRFSPFPPAVIAIAALAAASARHRRGPPRPRPATPGRSSPGWVRASVID
ncbi:hypothetical protein [Saccharothrix sp. ST-888]|uniref:hypothetical protein n=1 Tax=Saccharothrix sp. ST-888 TaxID=1427391 RepID=UPI0012E05D3A|nr:hypothetical protein [Saccharothrix sp. ST-888]